MLAESLLLVGAACAASAGVIVHTKLGQVEGGSFKSRSGRLYHTFTSLPYAEPPTGPLRLKNPVAPEGWSGVRDASALGSPVCSQVAFGSPDQRQIGQEDCLYLNIATHDVLGKAPVLVYLHGGGFFFGDAKLISASSYLMDKDIVYVSVSYRLGPLGFLSTEDDVVPGNFGLKDQAMAIRWLKENVRDFGGDPDSITLFGESAGGASVHLQMLSPLNYGMLSGGISESGTALCPWVVGEAGTALERAYQSADVLSCPRTPHSALLDCLQHKPLAEITRLIVLFKRVPYELSVWYHPVLEREGSEGAFLTSSPVSSATTLPWLTGVVSSEGAFLQAVMLGQPEDVRKDFEKNLQKYLPIVLMYLHRAKNVDNLTGDIMETYYKDVPILQATKEAFEDDYFFCGWYRAMKRHEGPLYAYLFDFKGGQSHTPLLAPHAPYLGVNHADELLYLLNLTYIPPLSKGFTEADLFISKRLVEAWTNFAKYKKPTVDSSAYRWTASDGQTYMRITEEDFITKKTPVTERCRIWDGIEDNVSNWSKQSDRNEL